MSKGTEELTGLVLDERTVLSLRDLCRACDVHAELVIEMVEHGVLQPRGRVPTEWRFAGDALIRAQKALRLTRDLHVNWPGAALAIELLDELQRLRRLERHRRGGLFD